MKVLIGCTGSVATIKVSEIVEKLVIKGHEVQVISTHHGLHFLDRENANCKIFTDEDEWNMWKKRGDPVLHIELKKWADVLLISPLDANSLAKIAHVSTHISKICQLINLSASRVSVITFSPA